MDNVLNRITSQVMTLAIRSGITVTTGYAIKQCTRLLAEAPSGKDRDELLQLQSLLEWKIRVLSPAIDLIEVTAARGNTSLEPALRLTKQIRHEVQRLGHRLSEAATDEECRRQRRRSSNEQQRPRLKFILDDIKALLARIDDVLPLVNLAITTSGVKFSTSLSKSVSPSRLLQASAFLTAADSQYACFPGESQQVGPTYTLSLYMLFTGHTRHCVKEDGVPNIKWKEVIHKAKVKLVRVPLNQLFSLPGCSVTSTNAYDSIPSENQAAEYGYQLVIIEDLDDDRVHAPEEGCIPGRFDEVMNAGIRDVIPIHEISKVFYADTGKILDLGEDDESQTPVLLLRRDVHAEAPRQMLPSSGEDNGMNLYNTHNPQFPLRESISQSERSCRPQTELRHVKPAVHESSLQGQNPNYGLPANLDPEWMALEVYVDDEISDSDNDDIRNNGSRDKSRGVSIFPMIKTGLLNVETTSPISDHDSLLSLSAGVSTEVQGMDRPKQPPKWSGEKHVFPKITTTLSLLEMLLKLTTLQQFRQESHHSIEDELLNFFLEESATAGLGFDKGQRRRIRNDAVNRVGFDPYDESPVKRRGEQYIAQPGTKMKSASARTLSRNSMYWRPATNETHQQQKESSQGVIPQRLQDIRLHPSSVHNTDTSK